MSKLLLSIILISSLGYAQTPIYLNFISHQETSDPLDYDGNSLDYFQMRDLVKEVCDTIISKKAKYNMQVDANFINGCLTYENGNSSSTDLLEWANNSIYIDVDGHNHFNGTPGLGYNPYNYADLAYLLDSCGLMLSKNILGGVTYKTTGGYNQTWWQYSMPASGFTFTDFIWSADIIWGTATPGHVDDLEVFGVWKPADTLASTFLNHDPNQNLTCIGGGCKSKVSFNLDPQTGLLKHSTAEIIQNVKDICDFIQTLPPSPTDFYTLNIMTNFRDQPVIPNFADSIAKIIDGVQPYVADGKIIWATLSEKYDAWYATHTNINDQFQYACEDVPLNFETPLTNTLDVQIYPNPSANLITIYNLNEPVEIEIINGSGQVIYNNTRLYPNEEIDISKLNTGIYVVRITTSTSLSIQKFIKS